MAIKIKEMNAGNKVAWTVQDKTITFGEEGNQVSIDLAAQEKDIPVTVTISSNEEGKLVDGLSLRYVANILIPPRRFMRKPTVITNADGTTMTSILSTPLPIDLNRITLQLWAVSGGNN
jgi:hypothetical protein